MFHISRKQLIHIAAFFSLALVVGCNSKSGEQSAGISITGAGSTFVNPIMTRWIADYQQSHPNVRINYQSIGSGAGIQQLKKQLVDFGASDVPLSDDQLKEMPPVVQVAESAGPVCITYNLPDLKEPLKLTSAALAGIYLGTIKTWRDPAITKANPGASLPDKPVVVVHRSESSGTTNIFTTYLAAVNDDWKTKVGKGTAVNWPTGLGAKGSEAVTGLVKQSEGGIGYVELNYASENHLPVAKLQNKAGQWVAPEVDSTTAAIAAFKNELDSDLRTSIVQPPASARDAYPISGLTYLLIPKNGTDQGKNETLKDFVRYVITSGQQSAARLEYAPLPPSLEQSDEKLLNELGPAQSAK